MLLFFLDEKPSDEADMEEENTAEKDVNGDSEQCTLLDRNYCLNL